MLPLWVDFFEDLETVRGRSQNTVMAYRRDLEFYQEFKALNKPLDQIYSFFNQKRLSARSQARLISSIRTYLKFCESRGLKSPELRGLKQPRVKASLPKPITVEEFDRLITASQTLADERFKERNLLTLYLLFGLGCRVSELIGLNISDFNETDRWIRIFGKGSKERLVPVSEPLAEKLVHYIRQTRDLIAKEASDSLLINDRGHRPSRVDIWRWLAQWSAKAGFDKPISPHQFRHGCATALLDSGADLRAIQMLLGHSSIQTTQVYTAVSSSHLKEAIDQYHPLSQDFSKEK